MTKIAEAVRIGRQLAAADIGYDQAPRWTFLDIPGRRLVDGTACDCSTSTVGVLWLAGFGAVPVAWLWTGNLSDWLTAAGFRRLPYAPGKPLEPGDVVLAHGHHVVLVLSASEWLSAEADERGRRAGGQAGDQTGREVRIRAPYDMTQGGTRGASLWRPPYEPGSVDVPAVVPSLSVITTTAPAKPGPLRIDGTFGPQTARRLQAIISAAVDGQWGPESRRKMQAWLGVKVDGIVGPVTVKALQRRVGAYPDGAWGPDTTRALQRYLNSH